MYNVSYMDQLCTKMTAALKDKEAAKVTRNELNDNFNDWKKETMKQFIENYPEEFKWQLEFDDWHGAMANLTDIYSQEKIKNDEAK